MERTLLDAQLTDRWRRDGWCLLEEVFAGNELEAAQEEVARLEFDPSWDAPKPTFPFEGATLNRLAVHDSLITLAEELLGTEQVRLYQGLASAKYSGGPPDYEQLLHVDYGNHTLVVPRDDPGYQHLALFLYLSDVTPETAATRMVSRRLTGDIPVERTYLDLTEYAALYAVEVPVSGRAGSVLAYRPDVYHRGTALSAEGATRFMLHVAYKPVGAEWVGYHAWPIAAEGASWHHFVSQATVRQLTAVGFPEPGHPYWTEQTLDGVAARYPRLDMAPWRTGASGGGEP